MAKISGPWVEAELGGSAGGSAAGIFRLAATSGTLLHLVGNSEKSNYDKARDGMNNQKLDSCHVEQQLVSAGCSAAGHGLEEIACHLVIGGGWRGHGQWLPALVRQCLHALSPRMTRKMNLSVALHHHI